MLRVDGLWGHVRRNDLNSLILFAGFLLAFQLMAAVVLFLPLTLIDPAHAPLGSPGGYLLRYVPVVAVAGAAMFGAQMWWHVQTVARATDMRYVDDFEEPRLCRIVEPLAIAAGIPVPFVAVIDTPACNAFACGIRPGDHVVAVTRGLLNALDDDELRAVVAHEIAHIAGRDTRLMAAANVLTRNLLILQAQNLLRIHDWRQGILMVIVPIFLPLLLFSGLLTQIAFRTGHLSRLLIASAREYIADAEAVRLTQNPHALVRALGKIEGRSSVPGLAAEMDGMMIDGATTGAMATHPTIAERVATLVRLTGPMALIGPAGRDTRAGVGRFGRVPVTAGPVLPAADASERPTWRALLRVSEGSDRNIFGLDNRTSLVLLAAVGALAVIHLDELDDPDALAKVFDLGPAQALLSSEAGTVRACGNMTGTFSSKGTGGCDPASVNRLAGDLGVQTGIGGLKSSTLAGASSAEKAAQVRRDRCFLPGGTGGGVSGMADAAAVSVARVSTASDTGRDAALRSYVETRKQLVAAANRAGDGAGAKAIYAGKEHGDVLSTLSTRMRDRGFVARLSPVERAEYQLLVGDPAAFVGCDASAHPAV